MTSLLKIATAALMLGVATVPAAAQKLSPPVIVIVDMDRIVNDSAAGKTAGTEIQTKITNLQTRATTLQTQLKTDADAIQTGQANKSLAGPALEQRTQAFAQKQQQAQQELGRLESDIQRSRQYVIKQISDAANPIITEVMRDRGATIALAEGATLQHSASLDVTNDVITRLNTKLPRVSTTPPAAPAQP
ncbi:OmpH family outer membrane protein [Sandaracinobacter sp. RS1-74]|uniref:OmpH family outer membrane protein n=1 Tax=Sandaracinobacteroides sayramensis TaxID=2913411 RepID=UPI001EDAE246|nr:OmpH family outer membrane protein [Sandaracinobacteroides sayramensis]MCG2841647.1 OmpH family outer membrane protein [Sandaracinobacteroides sayramensis]